LKKEPSLYFEGLAPSKLTGKKINIFLHFFIQIKPFLPSNERMTHKRGIPNMVNSKTPIFSYRQKHPDFSQPCLLRWNQNSTEIYIYRPFGHSKKISQNYHEFVTQLKSTPNTLKVLPNSVASLPFHTRRNLIFFWKKKLPIEAYVWPM